MIVWEEEHEEQVIWHCERVHFLNVKGTQEPRKQTMLRVLVVQRLETQEQLEDAEEKD